MSYDYCKQISLCLFDIQGLLKMESSRRLDAIFARDGLKSSEKKADDAPPKKRGRKTKKICSLAR